MIPFLRDHKEKYTLGRRALRKFKKHRRRSEVKKYSIREMNWTRVGFPISFHNEKNYFKNKIKFEDI